MAQESTDPIISLPQGGGAVSGLGETFSPDPHSGTGNFSIPIQLPAGRGGFEPSLTLGYSTGGGNGPFGLGWNITVPGVCRRLSGGVPRYDDLRDTFVLTGNEALVRVAGGYPGTATYRPRTEGLFARIEHVREPGQNYWRVRTMGGLTSWYGTPRPAGAPAGWADPAVVRNHRTATGVPFEWRLTRSVDQFGNEIRYTYGARDAGDEPPHHWDQPLLTEIAYADHGDRDAPDFAVKVLFTYGDRPDHFSGYRAGFEMRTTRRCATIRVETHTDAVRPVREYKFGYHADSWNSVSLLEEVALVGFDDAGVEVGELPPLEFGWTAFEPERRRLTPVDADQLPAGALHSDGIELIDLFGAGVPDVVDLHAPVRYWRNLGAGRFDRPREMAYAPSLLNPGSAGVALLDADGNGRADLFVARPGLHGVFPLRFGGGWDRRSFRAHALGPSFDPGDPEVRLVDLDGDGITDAIRSGSRMECYFNHPAKGWHEVRAVERGTARVFPDVYFSDERVRLADMTGDGLNDIVLVHDRNIEYWPSLGRGDWGARVSMRQAPALPVGYDPRRVHLSDLDGDGAADLVYVDTGRVLIWFNQGGDRWSTRPVVITGTPPLTNTRSVRTVDLLGNGTDQIVWSVDTGGPGDETLYLLDLTGGVKPYLLTRMDNRIGAVTSITYASSTSQYLRDQHAPATRWRTPLPIPVQVVTHVEVRDEVSGGRLTTEFRYHHGYWDGAEREFRGFGLVDRTDRETPAAGGAPGEAPLLTRTWFHQGAVGDEGDGWDEWDGAAEHWAGDPDILGHRAGVAAFLTGLPASPATRAVRRDALRTLRGRVLRTELIGSDGTARAGRPYTVTEHAYGLKLVAETPGGGPGSGTGEPELIDRPTSGQLPVFPDGNPRRPVFVSFGTATRTTQWERGDDPMTRFTFHADHDPFARPLRRTEIACPRGWRTMADSAEGAVATRTVTAYARPASPSPNGSAAWIMDRPARITSLAVTRGRSGGGADGVDGHEPFAGPGTTVPGVRNLPDGDPAWELTGQTVHHYDGPAFVGLDPGKVGAHGVLVRTEQLVLTEEICARAYGAGLPPYLAAGGPPAWTAEYPAAFRSQLTALAGYTWHDGVPGGAPTAGTARGWFAQTARRRYDLHEPGGAARGLVVAIRPPSAGAGLAPGDRDTVITYDAYGLFPATVTDPHGLVTEAVTDYRVWKTKSTTDPNGTVMRFAFTPLGLMAATWTTGTGGDGDQIEPGVTLDYDCRAFSEHRGPISVGCVRRAHPDSDTGVPVPLRSEVIAKREYCDGFGRHLQTRIQAADVRFGDEHTGDGMLPLDQNARPGTISGRPRTAADPVNVVVSGWQVFDAKGRPVEQFAPYFDRGWDFVRPTADQRRNSVRLEYDPRGTVVRTIRADGAQSLRVHGTPAALDRPEVFEPSPWVTYTYDANDNATRTHGASAPVPAHHPDTPSSTVVDPAGRVVESVNRNRVPGGPVTEERIRQAYDARGNPVALTDALGRVAVRAVFDMAGRALRSETIDAGTSTAIFDAAGTKVEARDGRGVLVLRAADRAGRPAAVWARDSAAGAVTLRERMTYGDGGRADQPPAERAANRAAYRLGKLVTHHDEAGRVDISAYDTRGNPTGKTRRVISDNAIAAGWVADWSVPGAENAMDPSELTWDVAYDALDRVTRIRYPEDPEGERKVLHPEYDSSGGLQRVALGADTYVERVVRNARGQRTLVAYGNGIVEASAHDPLTGRLCRQWSGPATPHRGPAPSWVPAGPGAQLRDTAYARDLIGNTVAVHERAPGAGTGVTPNALDRRMTYDADYQLLASSGRECDVPPPGRPWSAGPGCVDRTKSRDYHETYQYDPAGNLIKLTHRATGGGFTRTAVLEPGSNRLSRVDFGAARFDYTYDEAGNMTGETTSRRFEWDHAGRLRGYRTQAGTGPASEQVSYLYDSSGRRVKRLVREQGGAVESTVTIDDGFELHRRGAVVSATVHIMDDKRPVATVRVGPALPGDGAADVPVAYHLVDALGSGTVVVGGASAASAAGVRREEYGAWGETTFGSHARKRYRFAGKERDETSGLYDFGARHYAPWLGRWTSADPAGPADGLNLYAYARNNPVSRVDPAGTDSEYRDAGAGPTDVSGAGAQEANPPTDTQDTYRPTPSSPDNAGPSIPTCDVKDLPAAAGAIPFMPGGGGRPPMPGGPPLGAPGASNLPLRTPGISPDAFRQPFIEPPGAPPPVEAPPGLPPETATLPGAESATGAEAVLGAARVVTAATVVVASGATFASDSSIGPAPPSAAELDQAMVRIVREQNARLRKAVESGDLSLIHLYRPGLHKRVTELLQAATTNPWLVFTAYNLFRLAYGKTLELMVNDAIQIDPVASQGFEHLGGANQADWVGLGSLAGVLYDLTTEAGAESHMERFYGERMRIVTYDPPW